MNIMVRKNTCFSCGSGEYFIARCQKLYTSDKKARWNMEKTKTGSHRLKKKTSKYSTHESESQKIHASMAHRSTNAKSPRRYFGEIFDIGATCHMTP